MWELHVLLRAVGRVKDFPWKFPNEPRFSVCITVFIGRSTLGSMLALVAAQELTGRYQAAMLGACAPILIEQAIRNLPAKKRNSIDD